MEPDVVDAVALANLQIAAPGSHIHRNMSRIGEYAGIVLAADKSGKFKTAFQMISLIVAGAGWVKLFGFNIFEPTVWKIWYTVMLLVVFSTLYSGISYFVKNFKLITSEL